MSRARCLVPYQGRDHVRNTSSRFGVPGYVLDRIFSYTDNMWAARPWNTHKRESLAKVYHTGMETQPQPLTFSRQMRHVCLMSDWSFLLRKLFLCNFVWSVADRIRSLVALLLRGWPFWWWTWYPAGIWPMNVAATNICPRNALSFAPWSPFWNQVVNSILCNDHCLVL